MPIPSKPAARKRKPPAKTHGAKAASPLSPALSESFGYLIRYAYRTFDRTLAGELAPHGVFTAQWSLLRVLWLEEGLSQTEIAERMRVERASLTQLLGSMESAGLILRVPDTQDRRVIRIHATPRARALKKKLLPIGGAINSRATEGMSEKEIATMRKLLTRMVANLERDRE